MARKQVTSLPNVQTYGHLLPADALQRILNRDREMEGLKDEDYHLVGEKQNEAINRSWQKMLAVWNTFVRLRKDLASSEPGTSLTRETLLLPLFVELGYGRLSPARAEERQIELSDGTRTSYPISHFRDESPIHLVGCNVSLDAKKAGVTGAARQSPHSLVQEFLNRSDKHLWGFVSNGLLLRILRDNASLSRQAYVEFNLEGIFEEQSFSEFALLWLCAHQSRVHTDNEPPEHCWLERWSREAHDKAVAALEAMRSNVTAAIEVLGQGFMQANPELHQRLATGSLDRQDYFRQLLRLAYRLIFLFVLEERNILHSPEASLEARERYDTFWSLAHLRELSRQMKGTRHHDLWEGVKLVMRALRGPEGCSFLGLAPMGGFLWSDEAVPDIADLRLANTSLLEAMRNLAFTYDVTLDLRPVDWRHLGAQELGSIYEALLEQQPEVEDNVFKLQSSLGNDRKTTGSYYTPTPLIECLLESALDPVIERAMKSENPESALLGLKICDPACGSGHFLLAAARRIAKKLAFVRSGDAEPSIEATRHALRDVVARCLYGIDINPMSVELCKVGLWLETHEPGKPLSFLDHRLLCANSLMGTRAQAIREGIPDDAYVALGGDDRGAVTALKKQSREQRRLLKQGMFQMFSEAAQKVFDAVEPLALEDMPATTLEDMERREQAWLEWQKSSAWQSKKFLYDMWTAAFVLPRYFLPRDDGRIGPDGSPLPSTIPFGITWKTLVKYVNPEMPYAPLSPELIQAVRNAAREYQFFHMEVMFPEVAARGGFDVVLGNPPWERIKLQEKEWFAAHNCPDIVEAPNAAARRRKISALATTDPVLFKRWLADSRKAEGFSHFLRNSKFYPLCGLGDINLYSVFAEWMRKALNEEGRLGCIVPSGVATDDTTKLFFRDMVETKSLISLYDFENKGIFPGVHSSYKFSLLTVGSGAKPLADEAQFVFFAHATEELRDPQRRFTLSSADIRLLNPNTRTCPIFRNHKDAVLTRAVYHRVPVLIREGREGQPEENPWGIKFNRMFDMANDSQLFHTREQLEEDGWQLQGNIFAKDGQKFLPLYEAKMIHHFNHRWATYETGLSGKPDTRDVALCELQNPNFCVLPRYWVSEEEVRRQLELMNWEHKWLMGWRDICRSTDERTVISDVIPLSAVGDKFLLYFTEKQPFTFLAYLNSFCCDYFCRQKFGGTSLKFYVFRQLAVPSPSILDFPSHREITRYLRELILELTYTTEDLRPFARDMGYDGEPFAWDEERRALLRAQIDAVCFHLYLPVNKDGTWKRCERETDREYKNLVSAFPTPRATVDYIMDTFPITRSHDIREYGSYRTKELILEHYDKLLPMIVQP